MIKLFSYPWVWGVIGGIVLNIFNLIELTRVDKKEWPNFKSVIYWISILAWPILGGILVHLYNITSSTTNANLIAFQIGLTSPLIIRTLVTIPPSPPKKLPEGA